MLGLGIRAAVKRRIKGLLGRPEAERTAAPAPPTPEPLRVVPAPVEPVVVAEAAPAPVSAPLPVEEPAPTLVGDLHMLDDTAGRPLSLEAVQDVLDDMVRPALQADGGDIDLVRIEDDDIFVRLVGSCSSCPSSIATMKMGVERLLQEEFPTMRSLVQVEDGAP